MKITKGDLCYIPQDVTLLNEHEKAPSGYIKTLNLRSAEYSEYEFDKTGSNYSIYRHLAKKVQDAMGFSQTNKWVMDQIVDIDAIEICEKFLEVYHSLTKK